MLVKELLAAGSRLGRGAPAKRKNNQIDMLFPKKNIKKTLIPAPIPARGGRGGGGVVAAPAGGIERAAPAADRLLALGGGGGEDGGGSDGGGGGVAPPKAIFL